MRKKVISMAFSVIMATSLFVPKPVWADHMGLTVGVEEQEFYADAKIRGLLDQYFSYRESQFPAGQNTKKESAALEEIGNKISQQVRSDAKMRAASLQNMEAKMSVSFQNVTTEYVISSVSKEDDYMVIDAYEWNTIEYLCEGLSTVDVMGFGTDHKLYVEEDTDGTYSIVKDSFDEQNITGAHSMDIAKEPVNEAEETVPIRQQAGEVAEPMVYYYYNDSAAIAYANQWCGVSAVGTRTEVQHKEKYNPAYYYAEDDCANFVSQCIHAGGISTIGSYPDSANSWYYTVPPVSSTALPGENNTGSTPWIRVSAFDTFWRNHEISRYPASGSMANENNIIPGNPVYWLGHLMICTGYNSAGTPVINAHNGDAYKVPITEFINEGRTLYTLMFKVCAHSYGSYIYYGDLSHGKACSLCLYQKKELHTWINAGVMKRCTQCGYTIVP